MTDHMNQNTTHIMVWISNSKGEKLICRHNTESGIIWEPFLFCAQNQENDLEIIIGGVQKTVGLSLTPSMGKMLWNENCGTDGFFHIWRFDYQNESLDSFVFGNQDIQSALWADIGMIRELYQAGLFYPEAISHNLQAIVGEIKTFPSMHRHEMLLTINCLQELTVPLLRQNLHPEADIFTKKLLKYINRWIKKYNLEGTKESDYQRILAYSRLAHANMLNRHFDQAKKHFEAELDILERQNKKMRDSTLLYWTANVHGWLAEIYHESGKPDLEKHERELRASLIEEQSKAFREEMDDWRPGTHSWADGLYDRSVYDDQNILSMDNETDFITLTHFMSDYKGTQELIITDYTWNLPICRLTNSLYSDLSRLQSVKINTANLKDMDGNPFAGCVNLERIDIIPENCSLKMTGNCLMTGDSRRLICYLPAAHDSVCVIPDGTIVIGKNAFHSCKNLTEIIIPDSVRIIEDEAFYDCISLETINLPDGLTEISNWCFGNCRALRNIRIPSSVHRIGEFAFTECGCLNEIILPSHLDELDSGAFSFCDNLSQIHLPETVDDKGFMVFKGSPVEAELPEYQENDDYL